MVTRPLIRLGRALLGMALIQLALPKPLPLPGVSDRWLLLFLGGGVPGIIATLVGGVLLVSVGVVLLPQSLRPGQLAGLSAAVAVLCRLGGALLAWLAGLPLRWWPGEEPGTGLLLGLAVVTVLYGGVAHLAAQAMTMAESPTLGRSAERRAA